MEREMFSRGRPYFVRRLGRALRRGWPERVWLGDAADAPHVPRGRDQRVLPHPHLALQIRGVREHEFSFDGGWHDRRFHPGEMLYWPANGWWTNRRGSWEATLGLIYPAGSLRVVVTLADRAGRDVLFGYTTATPLGPEGQGVLDALSGLAATGRDAAATPLGRALLELSLEHLRADTDASPQSKAERTWQGVQHYLAEHYAQPLTRESVADAVGLHPNYLSTLCTARSGRAFHETLEAIRLDRAEHLLRHTGMTIKAAAESSGFSNDDHLRAAFNRRHATTPSRWRTERRG